MILSCEDGSVEFCFYRPGAKNVSLVGDFNGWQNETLPMQADPDGWWHCKQKLGEGVYQFKYLSDGDWFLDYAAFGLERGPFGWNSVVLVNHEPVEAALA
jgi:1,4-alpha-glucan branching enzyme